MTNLESILKSRDITFATNVHLVKAMIFPVVRYGCESWTIKKAETRKIDAFELWCWRRLLRVPWTTRRFNQSILKEISSEYSLGGLMLKLKLLYFCHLMQRTDSLERLWCWERLRAGGEGDDRGWDGWIASPSHWTWVWVNSGCWWWTGRPGVLRPLGNNELDTTERLYWNDGSTSLSFLRNLHTIVHCGCTNLHTREQRRRVLFWKASFLIRNETFGWPLDITTAATRRTTPEMTVS